MRTKYSIYNSITAMITNIITIIIGFIAQKIFLNALGEEYLGLNGLYTNIISMLSIVELGLGSAIIFNLYKPVVEDNKEEVKSLMLFYKKAYRVISILITIAGLCVMPFLNKIVGDNNNISESIHLIYLLFLIDVICSYLLSYKRSILNANQRNYYINIIHIFYLIVMNSIQVFILLTIKNYYLFLIVKIIMRIIENIIITLVANKQYSYLLEKDVKPLNDNILKDIIKKIRALFFHKIGSFIVTGTDNILISKLFGLAKVGLYSNYNMIISAVNNLFSQAFNAVTASVGNLIVTGSKEKQFDTYKKLRFINAFISIFAATSIFVIIQSFINVWIGSKYLLNIYILSILVINFYLMSTRSVFGIFLNAAGIFHENRFVPLAESSLNIVFSLLFAKYFGLIGIFLGTLVSSFALHFYSYPKYVYKLLFNKTYKEYAKEFIKYFLTFLLCTSVTYILSRYIILNNNYLELIKNMILSIIIPNILMIIIYRNTNEYKYFKELIFKLINKVIKRA